MKIKWERNSRVLSLAAKGKIKDEDILPKSRTDEFPTDAATVRMQRLSDKTPSVTIHIRGKSNLKTYAWNNTAGTGKQTYECANTCRVNISNGWKTGTMSSNGELDTDLTWLDVHNAVEEVKETMGV